MAAVAADPQAARHPLNGGAAGRPRASHEASHEGGDEGRIRQAIQSTIEASDARAASAYTQAAGTGAGTHEQTSFHHPPAGVRLRPPHPQPLRAVPQYSRPPLPARPDPVGRGAASRGRLG
ncbi:protein of unknown function [Cupriavidus taiwanensis]|uniref:Uncharacterized protein n=1 Tax=Cupriavidus taiwanensis TaxID=164546 RepID=A0A375IE55_9BURK|nr:protein of unknown function [Cupriavidus taiwanensis]